MYILILKEPKQIKNGIVDDDSEEELIQIDNISEEEIKGADRIFF